MSNSSSNRDNWAPGGFAAETGAKLEDGLGIREAFDEVDRALFFAGYEKVWVDGWQRAADGAIVTVGYSYREVRVRRYLPGHKEKQPQAIHNIRRYHDLESIERFVAAPLAEWAEQEFTLRASAA